ncbi:MAG: hypothetical protein ACRBBU_04060 [Pseudooceanicola sp.]
MIRSLSPKLLHLVSALLITASPAFAEVCDKERPNWNHIDGSVSQLGDLWLFFASPFGVGLTIVLLMAIYFRNAWVSGVVVLPLIAIAWLIGSTWLEFDYITQAAVREGCITSPVVKISVLTFAAFALVVVTFRRLKPAN